MKVAAIGFCCTDVYENLNRHYSTGNGIDCIVNLAKRGIKTSAVTTVGKDIFGQEMLDLCSKYGIDSSHIQINEGDTSVFYMTLKNGTDRYHIKNVPGVMENYSPTTEDIAFTKTHEYIHTDMFGHVLHLLPEFRQAGCKIILDFSLNKNFNELAPVLKNTDFGFFSFEEYNDNIEEFLKKAHSFGPQIVTATFGTDGSMSYDGKKFYKQGIYPAEVVNTVGAGDSFISGYIYGLIQGWDIPACLDCGARTSAEIVSKFDPY
ncbi:MAG: PfkB family carbohydrate kinase [Blautia sp.]|uniref:PfkB family carbohydrate kinase n=1 Tax=Blautia sp. TaxID=1955243 RepID=UPI0029424F3E|nr:PfkB family carbohydrate kinase [Blautia sp.]MDY3017672.1 PfkB family carbohydrate kinase [Blautia sp.]